MRCLPILFGIDVKDDFPIFFGCFYKFVYYCKLNSWPILAQEEYFKDVNYYVENFSINLDSVSKINEIPLISNEMTTNVDKYIITNSETNEVLKNYKNKDDAWIKLMNNIDQALEKILASKIKTIKNKYSDLSYVIVWRHNATINKVAEHFGLEVLEMELSGIRKPSYNLGLSYFQFSNKYDNSELERRYKNFINETENKDIPLLDRKNLIKLFLTQAEIDNICDEEYDIGIALGLKYDYETLSTNSITNEELLQKLKSFENNNNVIIRKHPANYNYKYEKEELFKIDNSISSIQFVSKCKKIVSSVSNIGLEAMLLGKTSYTLGKMPFSRFGYTNLDYNDDYVINLKDLNFLIFCYFAPYSLCLSQKYIEFRNSKPTEIDIYKYHYNYILNNYSNNNVYSCSFRANYIERTRKIKELDRKVKLLTTEVDDLKFGLENEKNKNTQLNEDIKRIYNSNSWKITKPLRYIFSKKR